MRLGREQRRAGNQGGRSAGRAGDGVLLVEIDYTVRATNSRFNYVYPFYLREASAPGGL